tara:strand:+ start:146 stop:424 length:279 start_codon:yes stop_codon:yes gene_type:complete
MPRRSPKPLDTGNAKSYKHAVVIWWDITGKDISWLEISEARNLKPARMITSGWILKEDEEYVVVASSLDTKEGLAGNLNAIPRCVIETIKKI